MYQQRPDQYDGIDRESAGLIDEFCALAGAPARGAGVTTVARSRRTLCGALSLRPCSTKVTTSTPSPTCSGTNPLTRRAATTPSQAKLVAVIRSTRTTCESRI